MHGGLNSCDHCMFKPATVRELKGHIISKHNGIRFSCHQCDYSSVREYTYEGVSFPCSLCCYLTPTPRQLRDHKQAKHTEKSIKCTQCDYSTNLEKHLKRHSKLKHENNEKAWENP